MAVEQVLVFGTTLGRSNPCLGAKAVPVASGADCPHVSMR